MVGIVLQNALNSSISAQYLRVSTTMMSRCTDTICRGSPLSTTADHLPCLICAAFGANRATFIVSAVSCSTVTPSGENRGVSGRFSMMTASDITAPSEGNRTTRHGSEGVLMVNVWGMNQKTIGKVSGKWLVGLTSPSGLLSPIINFPA